MYTIYAIKSVVKNYIYVGLTENLNIRLKRHKSGYEKTTRSYRPFVLIYSEECETRPEARIREKYLKSGSGKEFLKDIINK
jgi:putative endonuclease